MGFHVVSTCSYQEIMLIVIAAGKGNCEELRSNKVDSFNEYTRPRFVRRSVGWLVTFYLSFNFIL